MEKAFYSKHLKAEIIIGISRKCVIFFKDGVSFYDINKSQWSFVKDWALDKTWFTHDMSDFITNNIDK